VAFVDEIPLRVRSGAGGPGSVSFRREKFVPNGGPDGGDGGRGGDVVLVASAGLSSLAHLKSKRLYAADAGGPGRGGLKHGAAAADVRLLVPVGTTVQDADGDLLGELAHEGDELVVARGGRGGRGNVHFADSRRRAPRFSELGDPSVERELRLELKLIADVGLVGAPNAGKSTLLAALTRATPRIGDYPFTTLEPNLGVMEDEEGERMVLADVPGLIEGASEGSGLGTDFLRHLSRTSVLVHVLDASAPAETAHQIHGQVEHEIRAYDPELLRRVRVLALNKIDVPGAEATARRLSEELARPDLAIVMVSGLDGTGLDQLVDAIRTADRVSPQPQPALKVYRPEPARPRIKITHTEGAFLVEGRSVETIVARTNVDNPDALARMRRQLAVAGLREALLKAGAAGGDTVVVGGTEFVFDPDF
jgi:GTP-binding protein